MTDRCVATSVAGFIQQLAVSCIAQGYFFYVAGEIPLGKDAAQIDQKLLTLYDIGISKWARCRRKRAGRANVRYLRYRRFFILIATHGEHPFFTAEASQIQDIRRRPIRFAGYSVGYGRARAEGKFHASVRIDQKVFSQLKDNFESLAVHRSGEFVWQALRSLRYEPYAPVKNQLRTILRAVNCRRKAAGLELVAWDAIRQRRMPVKPFD